MRHPRVTPRGALGADGFPRSWGKGQLLCGSARGRVNGPDCFSSILHKRSLQSAWLSVLLICIFYKDIIISCYRINPLTSCHCYLLILMSICKDQCLSSSEREMQKEAGRIGCTKFTLPLRSRPEKGYGSGSVPNKASAWASG